MEGYSSILLIALIIIVVVQNGQLKTYLSKLEREIKNLQKQLNTLLANDDTKPATPLKETVNPTEIPTIEKPYNSLFSIIQREEIALQVEANNILNTSTTTDDNVKTEPSFNEKIPTDATAFAEIPVEPENESIKPLAKKQTFFERHPDMEKFIGENLVNKIGIAILVLAIGFFVKYAIDQNWIGVIGRVAIGIICGAILVALAHKMRNSYKSFSSVLAGGGLAVFYFTITLAYKQFNLFGQTTAFVIMLVITVFAVLLSILYNKHELAIISLVGGFIAPFLVSTGNGNYVTLFIYLIVLNTGLLIIAYNKSWRLLNLLSFIFTVFLYGSWLGSLSYGTSADTYLNGFLFAIIFYLLFFAINIAYNVSEKKKFIASDFGILLANTALFFGAGIYCLSKMGSMEYKGLFSASMGLFNLAASYFLFRKQKMDANILYLLIGITLTFISITAPLQLQGNYITLFWASETVLLYWLFTKSKIQIILYSSILVWVLMLISLFIDWIHSYAAFDLPLLNIVLNKIFITGVFAFVATYLLYYFNNKNEEQTNSKLALPNKNTYRIASLVLLYIVGLLEISYQFNNRNSTQNISILYAVLFTISFVLVFITLNKKLSTSLIPWKTVLVLFAASVVIYVIAEMPTYNIQHQILALQINKIHFMAHWLSFVLLSVSVYKAIQILNVNKDAFKNSYDTIVTILCAIIVLIISIEFYFITNQLFISNTNTFENIATAYIKTGLPILWGICSFVLMWLGMRIKYRPLRIISLSLFSLTLFKLFVFDIRNISAGGKIAAFFCLGILLLVVSFMYQRLKKIIIDDEKKTD